MLTLNADWLTFILVKIAKSGNRAAPVVYRTKMVSNNIEEVLRHTHIHVCLCACE